MRYGLSGTRPQQWARLRYVANNARFLILPGGADPQRGPEEAGADDVDPPCIAHPAPLASE